MRILNITLITLHALYTYLILTLEKGSMTLQPIRSCRLAFPPLVSVLFNFISHPFIFVTVDLTIFKDTLIRLLRYLYEVDLSHVSLALLHIHWLKSNRNYRYGTETTPLKISIMLYILKTNQYIILNLIEICSPRLTNPHAYYGYHYCTQYYSAIFNQSIYVFVRKGTVDSYFK